MPPQPATTSSAYKIHLPSNPPSIESHLSPNLLSALILTSNIPIPSPSFRQVLVRIRACALNYRDILVLASSPLYPVATSSGLSPCSDGVGEIISVGENSKWTGCEGDRVILVPSSSWIDGDNPEDFKLDATLGGGDVNGCLRQFALVGDEDVVKMPRGLVFEEAAGLGSAGGTAMNALWGVKKGMTVLTQGTGGVSCASIQLAVALGARVIATSSSDEKLKIAKSLGATDLINYKTTPEWADEALCVTEGRGVDLVIDVGGAGTIEQSLKAVRQGGTVAIVGILTPSKQADIVPAVLFGAKNLRGILGYSVAMLKRAVSLVEEYGLRPVVGELYEWEDAHRAFEAMREQKVVGKIVIKV